MNLENRLKAIEGTLNPAAPDEVYTIISAPEKTVVISRSTQGIVGEYPDLASAQAEYPSAGDTTPDIIVDDEETLSLLVTAFQQQRGDE